MKSVRVYESAECIQCEYDGEYRREHKSIGGNKMEST